MPYNFAADSFRTKKPCSRLSSRKVHFCVKWSHFEPPLGLGAAYAVHLRLIVDILLVIIEFFFARCKGWGATSEYTGWVTNGLFLKCITHVYNDVGRRSIYQNVQLVITSKTDILYDAMFKYSLHKIRETILHRKCQYLSMTFNYSTQFHQNWQSSLTMNIGRSTVIQHDYCVP